MTMELSEENKSFDKINFEESPLPRGEYEYCTFNNCNFANSDLSSIKFIDCTFKNCNLSLAKTVNTIFREAKFLDCKMLGLRFDSCSDFGLSFSFENCTLNHSTFFKKKIKKTIFKNSQLQEIDFTECDLTESKFDNCDLMDAHFERSILEKADFRTASNLALDPEINRIKKAKFSLSQLPGMFIKYDIIIDLGN